MAETHLALKFKDAINFLLQATKNHNSSNANTIRHLTEALKTAPDITVTFTVHGVKQPTADLAAGKPKMGRPTLKEIEKDDVKAEAEDSDKEK